MTSQPPSYTDRELKTIDILRKNQMAWIMFWFLLVVFSVILIALLYSVFSGKGSGWMQAAFSLLDGLVGWSIKVIVAYLFPSDGLQALIKKG